MAVVTSARAVGRPRRLDRSRVAGVLLVLPSLLYLTVFVFIPVIKAFATSFTVRDRDDAGNYTYRVGLDNYNQLIASDTLRSNVIFTVFIAVASVSIVPHEPTSGLAMIQPEVIFGHAADAGCP